MRAAAHYYQYYYYYYYYYDSRCSILLLRDSCTSHDIICSPPLEQAAHKTAQQHCLISTSNGLRTCLSLHVTCTSVLVTWLFDLLHSYSLRLIVRYWARRPCLLADKQAAQSKRQLYYNVDNIASFCIKSGPSKLENVHCSFWMFRLLCASHSNVIQTHGNWSYISLNLYLVTMS